MPEFPRDEVGIIDQARQIIGGLENLEDDFPAIPVNADELKTILNEVIEDNSEVIQLKAQLKAAQQKKRGNLNRLAEASKDDLDYLKIKYRKNPARLIAFGWAKRHSRRKTEKPDQPRYLEILKIDGNTLYLDWKSPIDGGKVNAYVVKRLIEGESEFQEVHTVVKTEAKLINQPRRVRLTYLVAAINKAGESVASNSVEVVL